MWHKIALLVTAAASVAAAPVGRNIGAIVLVNSAAPAYEDFAEFVEPYLAHLDIPYTVWDTSKGAPPDAALIIVGHAGARVPATTRRAVEAGAGLVSFDPGFPLSGLGAVQTDAQAITFSPHYITLRKMPDTRVAFRGRWPLAALGALPEGFRALASVGSRPLVLAGSIGKGRAVVWASYAWLDPEYLGYFAGMDDIVWRGFVWAARKPFVMQGMPPLVSMRVDDCAGGVNRDWAYVEAVNRVGVVPHCAFMLDEISEACARRMADLAKAGKMQVSIHARRSSLERNAFFWWDHARNRPFNDRAMEANYRDAERFLARHGIPHAKSINIHYEEMGRNAIPYLRKLGVEFVVSWTPFDLPSYRQDLFHAAPYLKHRSAGHWAIRPSSGSAGHLVYNPRAVMDWLDQERRFFDSYVDPIDIKYDWLRKCELAPYTGTFEDAGMVQDGVAMLRREIDSMFPAYYFTHEVNVNRYGTERFAALVRGVWDKIADLHPEPVSYDDLNRYARAQFTSRMERAEYDAARNRITMRLIGSADVVTRFWIYTGEGETVSQRMESAPPFAGATEVRVKAEP